MISSDVTSHFTNVPPTETICFIYDKIENNKLDVGVPKHYLKGLLIRCTFNVQFRFYNKFYEQTNGSPLGPLLAECFMVNTENIIR